MNELNHINGKGDKERSPGWRNNYPEITGFGTASGFTRVNAARSRKSYGNPAVPNSAFVQFSPAIQCGATESIGETVDHIITGIDTGRSDTQSPGDSVPALPPGEYSNEGRGGNASL